MISILIPLFWLLDIPALTFPPKLWNRVAWYHPTTLPTPPWVWGPGLTVLITVVSSGIPTISALGRDEGRDRGRILALSFPYHLLFLSGTSVFHLLSGCLLAKSPIISIQTPVLCAPSATPTYLECHHVPSLTLPLLCP